MTLKQIAQTMKNVLLSNSSKRFTLEREEIGEIIQRIEDVESNVNLTVRQNLLLKEENERLKEALYNALKTGLNVPHLFDKRI